MVKYSLMDQIGQKTRNGLAVKQAFFTKKPDALYAITAGWPGTELILRNLKVPASSVVTMRGVEGALKHKVGGSTLTIRMPGLKCDQAPCQHAYAFKLTGAELAPE